MKERCSKAQNYRNKEKEAQGGAAEDPIWSLFEMTWPPLLSDRIDFLFLILFLHLLRHCPLWYVRAGATGPSLTSTSPKSAYDLVNLCTPQITMLCLSGCVGHYGHSFSLVSILYLTYSNSNTIY